MTTIRVSFSLDDERDADIRDWLKRQNVQGNRSRAIRAALRQVIQPGRGELNEARLRRVLREELAGLARIEVEGGGHTTTADDQSQEDPELVAALEEMF